MLRACALFHSIAERQRPSTHGMVELTEVHKKKKKKKDERKTRHSSCLESRTGAGGTYYNHVIKEPRTKYEASFDLLTKNPNPLVCFQNSDMVAKWLHNLFYFFRVPITNIGALQWLTHADCCVLLLL